MGGGTGGQAGAGGWDWTDMRQALEPACLFSGSDSMCVIGMLTLLSFSKTWHGGLALSVSQPDPIQTV